MGHDLTAGELRDRDNNKYPAERGNWAIQCPILHSKTPRRRGRGLRSFACGQSLHPGESV